VKDEIRFHPAARAEAVAAAVYLEAERVGYGEKFDLELVAICDRIVRHPKSGSHRDEQPDEFEIRSFRMKTFRYSLIVATVAVVIPVVCACALSGASKTTIRSRASRARRQADTTPVRLAFGEPGACAVERRAGAD
jgi:plasmid stabilization system protein ParE